MTADSAGNGVSRLRLLGFFGVVFVVTGIAYLPAVRGGLLWDDDGHVTRADLQSWHGLGRIWGELGATQQYYPVLHSAFWVEHRLWGDAPVGYHLANILFHAISACLFALVLRRFALRGAWLGALIFALHPVCVESVAWISEQKNTLSTVFYLLAALVYLNFDSERTAALPVETKPLPIVFGTGAPTGQGPSCGRDGGGGRSAAAWSYVLATALFLLALLAKSVTATLPAALLVVIWWRRGRLSWKRDVAPLVPWTLLGAGSGLLTAWVERKYIGAQGAAFDLSLIERCLLAGRVTWFYLGKLLWPSNLIFIYPHWRVSAAVGWQYLFPLAAVAVLVALGLRRRRGPLAGLLYFVGTLFPALGFFNVYPFVFSYVADHFQYLASLGIFALAAAGWGTASGWLVLRGGSRWWGRTAAGAALLALFVLTWRQCRIYRDVQTLYRTTIERNPDCWMAHFNLGDSLLHEGRLSAAIAHYEEAVRIKPDYVEARNNLGGVLAHVGRIPEAIEQFEAALRIRPFDPRIHYNLGNALTDLGRLPEAIAQYERTIQLKPDHAGAHYHLGLDLRALGRTAEADLQLEEAARLQAGH